MWRLYIITGLPYWRIYRQIREIGRILKPFGYAYFSLAIKKNCKKYKKSCKRLISSEKINVLVKIRSFPEVWLFFCWVRLFSEVSFATVFSILEPCLITIESSKFAASVQGIRRLGPMLPSHCDDSNLHIPVFQANIYFRI